MGILGGWGWAGQGGQCGGKRLKVGEQENLDTDGRSRSEHTV